MLSSNNNNVHTKNSSCEITAASALTSVSWTKDGRWDFAILEIKTASEFVSSKYKN